MVRKTFSIWRRTESSPASIVKRRLASNMYFAGPMRLVIICNKIRGSLREALRRCRRLRESYKDHNQCEQVKVLNKRSDSGSSAVMMLPHIKFTRRHKAG